MASKKSEAKQPFEQVYQRLEEVVGKLETGGLTLEETIALYEEGMQLAEHCRKLLEEAELRVRRLQESYASSMNKIASLRETEETYTLDEEEELPFD
ncbi:MAG TPA: exodeoxyribonuclease VII small subunit [Dehalococcoidia bacterium]|nr:exodeoxyribonuclease VII small subunit [Dehalococcoidia bacterium]